MLNDLGEAAIPASRAQLSRDTAIDAMDFQPGRLEGEPLMSGDEMFDASLPPGSDLSSSQFRGMDAEVVDDMDAGWFDPMATPDPNEKANTLIREMFANGGFSLDPEGGIRDLEGMLGRKLTDAELREIFTQLDMRSANPGLGEV